ncbi:YdiU family protein [Thalassobius vesicularis]|uniref:Protein nucleotidyltransferase YdiU n=1 Tax=Thalassobius vesicularis TaxID=1294297 RepID=A0A4S3MAV3_9RHOB|nr:YdiU family protein [Thalassobius vesicularis]THD73463.1 YdiU family protein [Thalassobius vesicularis]
MTLTLAFDNSFATLPPRFYARVLPTPVAAPQLIAFNTPLAAELGITPGSTEEMAQVFAGNTIPQGAAPLAQAYAGHQFGGFSPQLGDGRAILLGEVIDRHGHRRDIQLKGSGPTPFSRRGDGRAWLGPVLREYVMSEAMYALGIPTTRALAAVSTGERIQRERGLPGAILTRVASSHLRVGTFQYFAARQDLDGLQTLFEYARTRHYPQAETPLDFLQSVINRQIKLVVQWLSIGFIHGVMNTDNTSISGETIDYGPAAYMDTYHPVTVYSSIDQHGRYAYDNQANVLAWNMAQLATALVPLMPNSDEAIKRFTTAIHGMADQLKSEWIAAFGRKIGLANATAADEALLNALLNTMTQQQADFTNTFRKLATGAAARDQFTDPAAFDSWEPQWRARLATEPDPHRLMCATNPAFIPRNHRVEQMIQAAEAGDYAPFHRLNAVLSRPYDDQPEAEDLTRPPLPSEAVTQTFCGT